MRGRARGSAEVISRAPLPRGLPSCAISETSGSTKRPAGTQEPGWMSMSAGQSLAGLVQRSAVWISGSRKLPSQRRGKRKIAEPG